MTAPLDPLLLWSDFLVCSKCKLSVRNSMGRRAEGGTAGVWIESVRRTVSVVSIAWSRWRPGVGAMVTRWFSTSSDMRESCQEMRKGPCSRRRGNVFGQPKNRRKTGALFKPKAGDLSERYDDPRSAETVKPLVLLKREKFARGFFCGDWAWGRDGGYGTAEF